jgi:uncharacterized protein YutE (UPF0331/DUF86 family)
VSLERYRAMLERAAFVASDDLQYQVLFPLTMAIQACIDIAAHVATAEGTRRPESYADAFAALAEAGLLEPPLAVRLEAAARARNLFVHRYWSIDPERIFDELTTRVAHLGAFAAWTAGRLALVLPA